MCLGRYAYLLGGDRLLTRLVKLLDRLLVVPEIFFAADKDDRETAAEMQDLRDPLLSTCQ